MIDGQPLLGPKHFADIASLIIGEHLGSGIARHVFAYGPKPDEYVVKVEYDESRDFQNVAEWHTWEYARKALTRWLAPCIAISPNGRVLLQARCEPCPTHLIPARVPSILGDLHPGNFGIYKGKVVVHDYGRPLALKMAQAGRLNMKAQDAYEGDCS